MKNQFTLRSIVIGLSIIAILCAWTTDHYRLSKKVQTLEQELDTHKRLARINAGDYRVRREVIKHIQSNFEPTDIPLLLYALADPDPGTRMLAMEVLEEVRLDARTFNQDPTTINSQPEYAFWAGVLAAARKNSSNWEQIKAHIEQLNQENPPTPNPFVDSDFGVR